MLLLSSLRFIYGGLKASECGGPHVIEVSSEVCHSFGIQSIEAARPGFTAYDEPRVFKHLKVLRNSRACDREPQRRLIDGQRAAGELLENGHAGGVDEGIKPGL